MNDWHPLLAAVEDAPGFWRMVAQHDRTYGLIRLIRRNGALCYSAFAITRPGQEGELIGYYATLRGAAEQVHRRDLNSKGPQGPANGRHDIGGAHTAPVGRSVSR